MYLAILFMHLSGSKLTHSQAQQCGIVPADPHLELRSLCDLLSHFVVNVTEKLEDHKIVFLLCACVCYIPNKKQTSQCCFERQ